VPHEQESAHVPGSAGERNRADVSGGADVHDSANEQDTAGDPACWLSRICPRCGAMPDDEPLTTCPRCHSDIPVA
jgi:hypothetical protein